MTDGPTEADARTPRLLIPDNTPLSLLAMIDVHALDWLFVPGAEVWVTDMVKDEALRRPDPGGDPRAAHRHVLKEWFERNARRLNVQATNTGDAHREAMELWDLAGRPPERRPRSRNFGERSILDVLDGVHGLLLKGECVVTIVDDRKARAALQVAPNVDLDLMGTRAFLRWIEQSYGVREAATAWPTIAMAAGGKVPVEQGEDPIHVRVP